MDPQEQSEADIIIWHTELEPDPDLRDPHLSPQRRLNRERELRRQTRRHNRRLRREQRRSRRRTKRRKRQSGKSNNN